MAKTTVEVEWLDPNQNMSLYGAILKGFAIRQVFSRPQRNYYILAEETDACALKKHLEKEIPSKSYRHIDSDGKALRDGNGNDIWTRDPTISIVETDSFA